ncbi:MAG TPA: tRNA dimethylallyltransferase, partial [Bacteroidota bacterium]
RKMGPSNLRRVVRALEVYHLTGVPISQHHLMQGKRQKLSADFYGLEWDRKKLYERIDRRVDWMLDRGLVDEVRSLKERGYDESLKSFQTVGYREVFELLAGITTREKMIKLIKQNSRRYAKRQLTWFRKERRIEWVRLHDDREFPDAARAIAEKFAAN